MFSKALVLDFLRILAVGLIIWELGTRWYATTTFSDRTIGAKRAVYVARPDLLAKGVPSTLVMVTASHCHFCRDSMPFYRSLFPLARKKGVRIVAVTPEDPQVNKSYLLANGLEVDAVFSAGSVGMEVEGTPTLLLLKADGSAIGSWIGKLPESDQREVAREVTQADALGASQRKQRL